MEGVSAMRTVQCAHRERAGKPLHGIVEGIWEMANRLGRNRPQMVSPFHSTVKCRECEIFIGTGHVESVPLPSPDGTGYLCRSCWLTVGRRRRPSIHLPTRWTIA
jgi:hypothetical protein